jgi:hypothetical protein
MKKLLEKIRIKLQTWLLQDLYVGYTIENNTIGDNCTLEHNSINLRVTGQVHLKNMELPEGFEVVIRKVENK